MHPGDPGATPYLFFAVEDMDAAIERVKELGGEIVPFDDGGDADSEALRPLRVLQGRPGLAVRAARAAGGMTRIVRHASELDRWEMVYGAPDPRLAATSILLRLRRAHGQLRAPARAALRPRRGDREPRRADPRPRTEGGRRSRDGFFAGPARHVRDHRDVRRAARRADRLQPGRRAPAVAAPDVRADAAEWSRWRTCSAAPGAAARGTRGAPRGRRVRPARRRSSSPASTTRSHPSRASRARSRACARRGRVGVQTLADELGCSRRHLNAGFREHVGIT